MQPKALKTARTAMRLLVMMTLGFCLSGGAADAQEQDTLVRDSRGTEFWLCFLPNFHNTPDTIQDSLFIFISADVETQVTIEYASRRSLTNYQTFSESFTVQPGAVHTFSVPYKQSYANNLIEFFELQGLREGVLTYSPEISQNERVARQSFHVVADNEIAVYGLNKAVTTSDAFLALPVDVLGNNYYVLSYNSHDATEQNATPSQFAVVATEDDTEVQILPSANAQINGRNRQTITLNEGEVYLVQARVNLQQDLGSSGDLSGSQVISDKPVAVFAGHQRSLVPFTIDPTLDSRDHLVQQLPPLSTWGMSAFITPFPRSSDETDIGTDLFRVIAALDGTNVKVGAQSVSLNAGQFFEGPIGRTAFPIRADGPIMTAQYRKSTKLDEDSVGVRRQSDPFMVLIPPVEQFLQEYLTINAQVVEDQEIVYETQYMTIVAPSRNTSSVVVEPPPLQPLIWVSISDTDYSYAIARVNDGVHSISADTSVGVYVYGYGGADSYGYLGGVQFNLIFGPIIEGVTNCDEVDGFAADTSRFNKPIKSVVAPVDLRRNVDVRISPLPEPLDTVPFQAELQNPYEDGEFTIIATDVLNLQVEQEYLLPGFTVHIDATIRNNDLIGRKDSLLIGSERCFDFELVNYGRFPQTIDDLEFRSGKPEYSLPDNILFPLTLEPGATLSFRICFQSDEEAIFDDTLDVISSCRRRGLAALNVVTGFDRFPPRLSQLGEPCDDTFGFEFSEVQAFGSGIRSAEIIDTVNSSVKIDDTSLPDAIRYSVNVRDRRADAVYHIEVTDSVGNTQSVIDTLPGFTLEVVDPVNRLLNFANTSISGLSCDSVWLHNYGIRSLHFERIHLARNIYFSAPISQLPLEILPGDTLPLRVCFHPGGPEDFRDSILLAFNCINEIIALAGTGRGIIYSGNSNCGVGIGAASGSAPGLAFIEPSYPNPSDGITTVRLGLPAAETVTLRVFDAMGNHLTRVVHPLQPGIYDLSLDLANLESGMYFYECSFPGFREVGRVILLK